MLAAVVFYSLLFIALFLVPALVIFVFLLFIDHERRLWRILGPRITPAAKAWWERPSIRKLRERYPRTLSFVARRLDPHDPWGLPATLATIAAATGIWFFLGVVQDLVGKDPLTTIDVRLHNSVPLFRSTGMTWLMLAMTESASPPVLWLICVGIALIALSRGHRRLAATVVLGIAGSGIVSTTLKAAFGFARPRDTLIAAHEASFPSGHMLSGAVVYGLLASFVLRSDIAAWKRATVTTLLLLFIACIGVSRLYLGVHWPSDILGSLALALVCLALLLFFLDYDRPMPRIDSFAVPLAPASLQRFGVGGILVAILIAAFLMKHTRIAQIAPPAPVHPISQAALMHGIPSDIPRRAEGLIGEKMEPLSLVLIGSSNEVIASFNRGGWTKADNPTPIRVMKESVAVIMNRPDPSGPATPAYLADRPQTLTFEKPDPLSAGIRRRHHTRVWQTAYCVLPDCRPIWVATASFDVGVEISASLHLPTHRIDPHIDEERALIVSDLLSGGATELGMIVVVSRLTGTNAAGDPFTTDGRAVILTTAHAR